MLGIKEKPSTTFTRATELLGICNLAGKRLKNLKQSAVSDHLLQCNYTIISDDFTILATNSSKFKTRLMESLSVKHDKPILNDDKIVFIGTLWLRWQFHFQYQMIFRFICNI